MLNRLLKLVRGTADDAQATPVAEANDLGSTTAGPEPLPRYLTRQPILDGRYRLAGYELSVRDRTPIPVLPGAETIEQIKDELLLVSVIDLEYQRALGDHLTVLNLAPGTLFNPLVAQLPPGKVIVKVAAGDTRAAVHGRCAQLAGQGIPLLLEDDPRFPVSPLLPFCHYVRVDCGQRDMFAVVDRISDLLLLGTPQLIAGNVETEDVFEACRKLPFGLYQGGFATRPQARGKRSLDPARMRVIELLNLVMNRHDIAEIESKLKLDAALTYRLLRYINAPVNAISQPIQSIGHAIMLLGYDQLYRWLTLMLFTAGKPDGRSAALLRNALVRARFMENLGTTRLGAAERGSLFTVGVLSQVDALLNLPLSEALAPLNLHPGLSQALLRHTGPYAPYLELARACEGFNQARVRQISALHGFDDTTVNLAHVNALIWSEGLET